MKNIFNSIRLDRPKSNNFDLSHDHKTSFKMGYLVPTCVMEGLPGDRFQLGVENLLRCMPMVSPVMHEVNVTTHYFAIPIRLLWAEWGDWIMGNSDVEAPYVEIPVNGTIAPGSLYERLGVPQGEYLTATKLSPMYQAAYRLVWDEYYRYQDVQDKRFVPLVPGDNSAAYGDFDQDLYRRAWMHDYFTAALPFAQKGDAVQLPLTTAPDQVVQFQDNGLPGIMKKVDGSAAGTGEIDQQAGPVPFAESVHTNGSPSAYDPNGTLVVDVQSDAVDINTLRYAFRLQEWLERAARGGTRYIEGLKSFFDVNSSDARMQRPEYIGGSKQKMVISEVLQTATTADGTLGQMGGHGISVGGGNTFSYYCEEHCIILGLINVQPVTAYQQGLHRKFTRFSRFDYAWPTFAHLGEQEVKNKELYAVGDGDKEATFGYVPRYAEYKFENSRVSGQFTTDLDTWHMGRIFASDPALNEEFIEADPTTRIFAVTAPEDDHIVAHIFNKIRVQRKLPRYGTPSF